MKNIFDNETELVATLQRMIVYRAQSKGDVQDLLDLVLQICKMISYLKKQIINLTAIIDGAEDLPLNAEKENEELERKINGK